MADQKISQLPGAAALTGTELIELVQGGANVRSTATAIGALAPSSFVQLLGLSGNLLWNQTRPAPRSSSGVQPAGVGTIASNWQAAGSQTAVVPSPTAGTLGAAVGFAYSSASGSINRGVDFYPNAAGMQAYRKCSGNAAAAGFGLQWLYIPQGANNGTVTKIDQTFFVGWAPTFITLGDTVVPSALLNMVGFAKDQATLILKLW